MSCARCEKPIGICACDQVLVDVPPKPPTVDPRLQAARVHELRLATVRHETLREFAEPLVFAVGLAIGAIATGLVAWAIP